MWIQHQKLSDYMWVHEPCFSMRLVGSELQKQPLGGSHLLPAVAMAFADAAWDRNTEIVGWRGVLRIEHECCWQSWCCKLAWRYKIWQCISKDRNEYAVGSIIFSVFVQIIAPCPLPKAYWVWNFHSYTKKSSRSMYCKIRWKIRNVFSGREAAHRVHRECPKVNLQMVLDKGFVAPLNHSKTRQTTLSLLVPAMISTRIRRRVPPEKPVPGRCRVRFSVSFGVKHIHDMVVAVAVEV